MSNTEFFDSKNYELNKGSDKGVYLIHGFTSTTYELLDLAKFLFGEYEMTNHTLKTSEKLKLDVYDSFKGESVTKKDEIKIEFSLSMAVKKIEKYIKIYTEDNFYTADFINNTYSSGKEIKSINSKKSLKKTLLKAQHQMILNNDVNDLSNFDDGLWLVNLIDEIQREYA